MFRRAHIAALLLATGVSATPCPGADPPWYLRQATWQETMRRSREALARQAGEARQPAPLPDLGRDGFTIAAWVRTAHGGTILAVAPPTGKWARQAKALFIRRGLLSYDIGWVGCVDGQRRIADGKWHHVALTGGKGLRLYVDGRLDQAGRLAAGADVDGHVVKLGYASRNFPSPTGFRGLLDDVRVYARDLTPAEVGRLAADDAKPPADGLVAHWPFDGDAADAVANRPAKTESGLDFAAGRVGRAVELKGRKPAVLVLRSGKAPAGRIWPLLERDFPAAADRESMARERADGIWTADWPAGDVAALARRYARAAGRAPALAARAATRASAARTPTDLAAIRKLYQTAHRLADAMDRLGDLDLAGIRRAVRHLARCEGYDADRHLAELDSVESQLAAATDRADADAVAELAEELAALRRRALVDESPLLGFDRLLFVRRHTFQSSHYYTDYIDGCAKFGGNLCILDRRSGEVTELAPSLEGGIFGRFDLSFDGQRVVFGYKRRLREGFRIYEVNVDGTRLRQLTFPPPDEAERIEKYWIRRHKRYFHHTDDMHPCYLPDGGLCFISTRCERGILCDGPDILTTTALYRMDADGKNMRCLSQTPVSEAGPSIANDGRILYTRWEYIDKGGSAVKCLWAMRPDGSMSVEVFGNDHAFPAGFLYGRAIPGRDDQFVCIGAPHMPLGIGTVLRIDVNLPVRTRQPMTYITPDIDIRTEWGFFHRRNGNWKRDTTGPFYIDPWPLDASNFLVTCNPGEEWNATDAYGLYLLDEFGNRLKLHDEEDISCFQPVPLRPRRRPPVLADGPPEPARPTARVLMTDVTQGLDGVPHGTVKYIRVMEDIPRPWAARRFWPGDSAGQQHAVVTCNTHTHVKVLHGIVPVEADGSAYFTVPARRNIFFQALDANFMEVQRMRTFVDFQPGEYRSCIGCHEPFRQAPAVAYAAALEGPPKAPAPQPGEGAPRCVHYPADVQPILDRHCIGCHGGKEPKAKLDLTGTETRLFTRSYENLTRRGLVKVVREIGSKMGAVEATPPYTWGSHASKLIDKLRKGHHKVKLSRREWVRLVTWVDCNAPFYGSYFGRRNVRYKGHRNYRPTPRLENVLSGKPPLPDDER